MNPIIKSDLYRYNKQTKLFKGFLFPGFSYMYFLRKASKYKRFSLLGLFFGFFVRRLGYKFGFQIPIHTKIGKGFYIGHFGTIVINARAVIGENCNIAHNTTIGQSNRGKKRGCPTIGNYVGLELVL